MTAPDVAHAGAASGGSPCPAAQDAALPERWPAGGSHGRVFGGQAQMEQVAGDAFRVLHQRA
jgi:hypothetical protein